MGVEYKHYLIPRDNAYRPEPEQLSRLVNALHKAGFLGEFRVRPDQARVFDLDRDKDNDPETPFAAHLGMRRWKPFPCPCTTSDFAALDEREYRLVWSVADSVESGLDYPLLPLPPSEYLPYYYDLEFHVANNFVYETSEHLQPFTTGPTCQCGKALEFSHHPDSDDYWSWRIYRFCPSCGLAFRPQELLAEVRGGWAGGTGAVRGGATYLFAVVLDCGKCFSYPDEGGPTQASAKFLEVMTETLGQPFYQVGMLN